MKRKKSESQFIKKIYMKKNQLIIILAIILISGISIFAQDLKVFDLEFNKPLTIRECEYGVYKSQQGRGLLAKKTHGYSYVNQTLTKGSCFRRVNNRFFDMSIPRSESLPVLTMPKSAAVKIVYSNETRPNIVFSSGSVNYSDIEAEVDENGNLIRIRFLTEMDKSKEILQILLQKYGKYTSAKDYEAHSPYGSIREFSIFSWELPKLKILYQTLANANLGYSTLGNMEITYQTKKIAPKDNNPL